MKRLPNTPFRDYSRHIAHGYRGRTKGVVIHVIDGPMSSALHWFKDPRARGIGAHVVIGLKEVYQLTSLDNVCWHAASANAEWIGFEHEGVGGQSAFKWNARRTQRKLSANRAAWICYHYRLGTPTWGKNIRPHSSFPAGGHPGCPGKHFPKTLYMMAARRAYKNLVKSKGQTWAP